VRGLERELAGQTSVVWLNVDEAVGRQARAVYGNQKVPAIILLDGAGREIYRTEGKLPRVAQIRAQLAVL
jgi:hypothetical protein